MRDVDLLAGAETEIAGEWGSANNCALVRGLLLLRLLIFPLSFREGIVSIKVLRMEIEVVRPVGVVGRVWYVFLEILVHLKGQGLVGR